jgi:hypothetical protein
VVYLDENGRRVIVKWNLERDVYESFKWLRIRVHDRIIVKWNLEERDVYVSFKWLRIRVHDRVSKTRH